MLRYVIVFEPYHDNSEVLGLFDDYDIAMKALEEMVKGKEAHWDNSDTYDLQEWDIEQQKMIRIWHNHNPHEWEINGLPPQRTKGQPLYAPPKKMGWRIKEGTVR